MLDALVVVEDGEARHFAEVCQVVVVAVTTFDEDVTSRREGALAHAISDGASHAFFLRLAGPIRPCRVVKGGGAAEFSSEHLRLALDLILDLLLPSQVIVVLIHGESVVSDRVLGFSGVHGFETLLWHFAYRLSKLVAHDVPVADLLVNRWVVDERAIGAVLLLLHCLLLLHEGASVRHGHPRAIRGSHDPVVHPLNVFIADSAVGSLRNAAH